MNPLLTQSATTLARSIRSKAVSSVEVVQAHVAWITQCHPRLNAVVQLPAETALQHAREADARLSRGEILGPLHGVPFTAKDIFETAGVVSAAGMPERAGFVPQQDATVIRRMRAAGAILIGKTNCPPEGASGESANPVYGRTNNPYDLERTPGGSSGGEAAIIAAGGSPLGLGSDSGGSLRLPAHFCGIATLRPSAGRVPTTGTVGLPGGLSDPRSQIGPLSRWVEDLGLALEQIAGEDGHDAGVVPVPFARDQETALRTLRIACYTHDGFAEPTEATVATLAQAARALEPVCRSVEEATPPALDLAREVTLAYWRFSRLTGREIEQWMAHWDTFRTAMLQFMAGYDILLCPAAPSPAFPHGQKEINLQFSYALPFSLTGQPSVVVRVGTSPEGLPIGVQITARRWREVDALVVARHLETRFGGWRPPIIETEKS